MRTQQQEVQQSAVVVGHLPTAWRLIIRKSVCDGIVLLCEYLFFAALNSTKAFCMTRYRPHLAVNIFEHNAVNTKYLYVFPLTQMLSAGNTFSYQPKLKPAQPTHFDLSWYRGRQNQPFVANNQSQGKVRRRQQPYERISALNSRK